MCLACCDPAKLAQVAKAERPNNVDIPASGFITLVTQGDALVRLVSAGHYAGSPLTLIPTGANLTTCTWRKQGSSGLFIPGPGNWTINNTGLSNVQVEVFTAYCGAAFAAYAQTGYEAPVHSAPTLDSTPLSTLVLAAIGGIALARRGRRTLESGGGGGGHHPLRSCRGRPRGCACTRRR
jgi:hypothetical protein